MKWRIWYKGNIKFDGETQQDWAALPDDGVFGIVIYFGEDEYGSPLREWVSGSDWYWMHDGKIYQSGDSSYTPDEWLPHNAPDGAVLKKGRWTTEEDMAAIEAEMLEWVK